MQFCSFLRLLQTLSLEQSALFVSVLTNRAGRLLAIINHQGKIIQNLRSSLAEKTESEGRLHSDVANKQLLLEVINKKSCKENMTR